MAVAVFVDPGPGLDVVVAVPVLGDLQDEPMEAHRVVVADGALLLDAEDVVQVAGKRHEGLSRLLGRNGEAFVVLRQEGLGTVGPFLLIAVPPPPERPLQNARNRSRLRLAQLP